MDRLCSLDATIIYAVELLHHQQLLLITIACRPFALSYYSVVDTDVAFRFWSSQPTRKDVSVPLMLYFMSMLFGTSNRADWGIVRGHQSHAPEARSQVIDMLWRVAGSDLQPLLGSRAGSKDTHLRYFYLLYNYVSIFVRELNREQQLAAD